MFATKALPSFRFLLGSKRTGPEADFGAQKTLLLSGGSQGLPRGWPGSRAGSSWSHTFRGMRGSAPHLSLRTPFLACLLLYERFAALGRSCVVEGYRSILSMSLCTELPLPRPASPHRRLCTVLKLARYEAGDVRA